MSGEGNSPYDIFSNFLRQVKIKLPRSRYEQVILMDIVKNYLTIVPSMVKCPAYSQSSNFKKLMVLFVVQLKDIAVPQIPSIQNLLEECSGLLCISKFEVTPDAIYFY